MYQYCVVVFCVLTTVNAGWLEEITNNGEGLQLGNGITLHVDELTRENVSVFEKHALRINFGKIGLSLEKLLNKDALQLGIYVKDKVEGRGKKVDDMIIPAVIGFKVSAIAALFFSVVTFLVLKSIALSNLSATVAGGVLLSKYLTYKSPANHIELEQSPHRYYPSYYGYPSAMGYNLNGANVGSYYSYPEYDLTDHHRSEANGQYSVLETPEDDSNSTAASKRLDKRKQLPQKLPLTKYKL